MIEIKTKCIEKNLTYEELAKITKVNKSTISNWANGRIPKTIESFIKLCKVLDIDVRQLK